MNEFVNAAFRAYVAFPLTPQSLSLSLSLSLIPILILVLDLTLTLILAS